MSDSNFSSGGLVKIGSVTLGLPWSQGAELNPNGDANPVQIQYYKRFSIVQEECIPQRKVAIGQNWGLWEMTITIETLATETHDKLMLMLDGTGAGPYYVETDGLGGRQMVFEDASFSQKGGESGTAFYWTLKLVEYIP